jgi:hypothetical protein
VPLNQTITKRLMLARYLLGQAENEVRSHREVAAFAAINMLQDAIDIAPMAIGGGGIEGSRAARIDPPAAAHAQPSPSQDTLFGMGAPLLDLLAGLAGGPLVCSEHARLDLGAGLRDVCGHDPP